MQLRNQMSSLLNSAFQLLSGVAVCSSPLLWWRSCSRRWPWATTASAALPDVGAGGAAAADALAESHFQVVGEVLAGLSTVRAFRKEASLSASVEAMMDALGRCLRCNNTIRRWLELRLEAFGSPSSSSWRCRRPWRSLSPKGANAALVGLSLSYALKTTGFLKGLMTSLADASSDSCPSSACSSTPTFPPSRPWHCSQQTTQQQQQQQQQQKQETEPRRQSPSHVADDAEERQTRRRCCSSSSSSSSCFFSASSASAPSPRPLTEPLLLSEEGRLNGGSGVDYDDSNDDGDPPAWSWPRRGAVSFEGVVMAYRPGLPPVLRGLSFEVPAGATVGIVGRTGSGKSSLFNALLRLTGGPSTRLEGGRILIDGRDVSVEELLLRRQTTKRKGKERKEGRKEGSELSIENETKRIN